MILVVCAVPQELRHWKPRAHVELLATGIGPVEAAASVAQRLATSKPECVINAGIAGGFMGRAKLGDAFAIENDYFAELGLEGGAPSPAMPGGARLVVQADSDPSLLETARTIGARIGNAITVATITGTQLRAEDLAARFEAEVEAMEGFAVLRCAAIAGVPAIELRGISNVVGPRETGGWDFDAGARAVCTLLDRFLDAR